MADAIKPGFDGIRRNLSQGFTHRLHRRHVVPVSPENLRQRDPDEAFVIGKQNPDSFFFAACLLLRGTPLELKQTVRGKLFWFKDYREYWAGYPFRHIAPPQLSSHGGGYPQLAVAIGGVLPSIDQKSEFKEWHGGTTAPGKLEKYAVTGGA
jgi:hypothetical protein